MCLQRLDKTDLLGNRLHKLDFLDPDQDRCDYFELDDNKCWQSNHGDLTILQLNIRGLFGKQNELRNMLNSICGANKVDIVLLQETWLTSENKNRLNIPGYKHFAAHRPNKKGGGVSILINDELKSREISLKDFGTLTEAKFVEIKLEDRRLVVGSMYRPPNSKGSDFITNFEKIMKILKLSEKTDVIIGLDHNLDFLKASKHKETSLFINRVFDYGLLPCITRPTRITHTSASLIDNILVSGKLHDHCLSGIAISDLSDHLPVLSH